MTTCRVLDVGNCDKDHGVIRAMLAAHFDAEIDRVMHVDKALEMMRRSQYSLVLFNRLIFEDGSEGIELLRRARAEPALRTTPIMMVSNFAEAQRASAAAGGEPGFGKAALTDHATIALLSRYLPLKRSPPT